MPASFPSTNHLGVSLEPNAVRGVAVSTDNAVVASGEVSFTTPVLQDQVSDPAALTAGLKQLKEKLQQTTEYVAICLPEKYAFSREHSLPLMPFEEVSEAISWQLDSVFPFDRDDVYIDWKLLSQTKDSLTVLIVAIQKTMLDQLKACCEQAGLLPVSFEPSASAVSRLTKTNNQSLIIVELNSLGSTATAVIGEIASLTTTTFFHSQSPPQEVLGDIVKSIQNLETHSKNRGVTADKLRIIITGEKASAQIAQVLQTSLNHPVEVLAVASLDPRYHVAYAAASSLIEPPQSEHTINLLPTALQEYYAAKIAASHAKKTIQWVSTLTLIGVAIAVAGFIYTTTQLASLTAKKTTPAPPATTTGITADQVRTKAQKIIALFPKKVTPEQQVSDILTLSGPEITLTGFTIDKTQNKVLLIGQASSRQSLLGFKDSLQKNTWAKSVNLPLSSLESELNPDFSIEIIMNVKP